MPRNHQQSQVLIVDDEAVVRNGIGRVLERNGVRVTLAEDGERALEALRGDSFCAVLLDIKMPGVDGLAVLKHVRSNYPDTMVVMITGYPTMESAIECLKMGAADYLVKPFRVEDLESILFNILPVPKGKNGDLETARRGRGDVPQMVGKSPAMRTVYTRIRRAAPSDSTVLISGESGTGKELVARAIHGMSLRADREFVPVDCSALVESLLESELFGHVKGSFTGAYQTKHGLFELADNGTFFFDEISNLSLNIQAKLLRVIQEREFMKIGSQKRVKLNIRIIASTNRDLREAVKLGTFREDLFYRLSVIPIPLPPLRERTEDIPLLVEHFIRKHGKKGRRENQRISERAVEQLCAYPWPGNVRELEHAVERILILEDCEVIEPKHLPAFITRAQGEFDAFSEDVHTLEELEKRYIRFVLHRTKGRRQEAARILGINRKTLTLKIRKHGLLQL